MTTSKKSGVRTREQYNRDRAMSAKERDAYEAIDKFNEAARNAYLKIEDEIARTGDRLLYDYQRVIHEHTRKIEAMTAEIAGLKLQIQELLQS